MRKRMPRLESTIKSQRYPQSQFHEGPKSSTKESCSSHANSKSLNDKDSAYLNCNKKGKN